jgi:hypothetical protein
VREQQVGHSRVSIWAKKRYRSYAIESAKGSLYNAFIGLAIVVLCRVLANLVGGALGAPTG